MISLARRISKKVHNPLLNRLSELAQQRSFYPQSELMWITHANANVDKEYLDHLLGIAKNYSVKKIIFDGSEPNDESIRQIRSADLEYEIFDEIKLVGEQIIDVTSPDFGKGGLPYLNIDQLLIEVEKLTNADAPIYLRIDGPNRQADSLVTWANAYAISYYYITGETNAQIILADYCKNCFGSQADQVAKMFTLARTALEKSFLVLDILPVMNNSTWPTSLSWLDDQVEKYLPDEHPLRSPDLRVADNVDFEKIEALECAHDAYDILEEIGKDLPLDGFLWLEHYFLHLKVVCTALRLITKDYLRLRASKMGNMNVPDYVSKAMSRDLFNLICDYRAVLTEFDAGAEAQGILPLKSLLNDWENFNKLVS